MMFPKMLPAQEFLQDTEKGHVNLSLECGVLARTTLAKKEGRYGGENE